MSETMSVTMPPEPGDLAVVLDREGRAWQRQPVPRIENRVRWMRAGVVQPLIGAAVDARETWHHLVVDHGPLTLLEPVGGPRATAADGWRDAGYSDQGCQSFTEPSAADAPADGWRQAGYAEPACRHLAQTA